MPRISVKASRTSAVSASRSSSTISASMASTCKRSGTRMRSLPVSDDPRPSSSAMERNCGMTTLAIWVLIRTVYSGCWVLWMRTERSTLPREKNSEATARSGASMSHMYSGRRTEASR